MRLRLAVLIVLALFTLGYRGAGLYLRYFSPDMRSQAHFGVELRSADSPDQDDSLEVSYVDPEAPAYEDIDGNKQLPKVGDRVVEIFDLQGRGGQIHSMFDYGSLLRRVGSVHPWTLVLDRPLEDGTHEMVVVSMPPGKPVVRSWSEWIMGLGYDLYLPLIALAAGIFIGLMKPEDNRAFVAALVFLGFSATFRQDFAQFHAIWREIALFLGTTAMAFSPVLILQFFFVFPGRSIIDRKLPWLRTAAFVASSGFWIVSLLFQFALHHSFSLFTRLRTGLAALGVTYSQMQTVFTVFAVLLVGTALAALVVSTWTAENRVDRRRMNLLAVGTLTAFLPLGVISIVSLFRQPPDWLLIAAIPFVGVFPLSFVYAVVKHRVFGVRLILRRGLQYALVSKGFLVLEGLLIFAVLYFGAVPLLSRIVTTSGSTWAWAGAAVLTFALLTGVPRLNAAILPAIDRRFFRDAYSAEKILSELSHAMRDFATTPSGLLERVVEEVGKALHPARIGVFLAPGVLNGQSISQPKPVVGWRAKLPQEGLPDQFELTHQYQAPPTPKKSLLEHDYGAPVLSSRMSLSRHLSMCVRHSPDLLEVFPVDRLLADDGAPAPGRVLSEDFLEDQAPFERFDTRLVIPLITSGRMLGFMLIGDKQSQEPFTRADKNLLLTVAEQASIALDYSRLIQQVAEQESIKRELQIARDVQAKLFPQDLPPMRTLSYTGVCRTAREVGGDYYDFLQLDANRLGIALGDIAGKGISASLLMASLQALLRSHSLTLSTDLQRLVSELNRHLCLTTEDSRFATFFFGTYDDTTRQLRFVNAGHCPPLLVRPSPNGAPPQVRHLNPGGTVLGMFPEVTYLEEIVEIEPDDLLIVFSDGITEAMNPQGEQYGEQRLLDLVASQNGVPVTQISMRLFADIDAFVGDFEQQDDMTMITARVL